MVIDDRRKINVWVPGKLWEAVEKLGYESPTKATIAGFESLLSRETLGSSQEAREKEPGDLGSSSVESGKLGSSQENESALQDLEKEIQDYKNILRANNAEIERLKSVIHETPDSLEYARLQARNEELGKHTDTLKNELEKAGQREEDLKKVHNNYMLQVQSLINQKAIEAPGNKNPWWRFW